MSGYTPYYSGGWQSGESGGTPITPAALNNMESGIGAALTAVDVVNNLTSTSTDKPLSAAQGKVLNDKITNKITTESVLIPWSDIPSGSWAARGGLYRANVDTINYFSKTPNVIQMVGWNGSIVPIVQMDGSGAVIQIIAGQAIPQDTSGGVTINGYFFSR